MPDEWSNVGFELTEPRRFFQGFLAAKKPLPAAASGMGRRMKANSHAGKERGFLNFNSIT
ncbi:hypothetical protein HZA44_02470 [Candidatus Peregrinibacteria bacterium]|nr:hypothetical protein [Candidatus Peregrinibacteria bacterium]